MSVVIVDSIDVIAIIMIGSYLAYTCAHKWFTGHWM